MKAWRLKNFNVEKNKYTKKSIDSCEIRTHAGCPTGLAGQRLNHSAKLSLLLMEKKFKI